MKKVTAAFFVCLFLFIGIFIGDTIDKSEYVLKTSDNTLTATYQAAQTTEEYLSIGELLTAIGALVTGIISLTTRNK